jgi:tetratricopeptide (TPR) repeat protein
MEVPPLPSPDGRGAGDKGQYSALALFAQSVRRIRPDYELPSGDLPAVARICRLVQGLPLAILLAATWMRMLSPAEIASEIEGGLDFLETDWREVPERHTSLRAVFSHSWDLLTTREREVLSSLSVFRGGCTRQAAAEVCGATLRELMALVNASLLQRVEGAGGRYELHELLRQYAAERLAQSPDAGQAVRDRHSAHYTAALRQWSDDVKCARQVEAVAEMDLEFGNARGAWLWAAERGHVAYLEGTFDGLTRYWYTRWRLREGVRVLEEGASHLSAVISPGFEQDGAALRVLSRMLTGQGDLLCGPDGDLERSKQLCRRALDLLERPALAGQDTRAERAAALGALGSALRFSGERAGAIQAFEQSTALHRALGDRFWTAFSIKLLGDTIGDTDYERYVRLNREALALAEGTGDRTMIGLSLNVLVRDAMRRGDLAEAEELGRESVQTLDELGNGTWLWWAMDELGRVLLRRAKYEEARGLFLRGQAINGDLGNLHGAAWTGVQAGNVELHLGRYARARSLGARAGYLPARERPADTGARPALAGQRGLGRGSTRRGPGAAAGGRHCPARG